VFSVEEQAEKETRVKAGGKQKSVCHLRYVPPKRRLIFNGLHDVISVKIELSISTAVRISNPTLSVLKHDLN
jgi:hypothetical protein